MSYVLHLWIPDAGLASPQSPAAAMALCQRLASVTVPQPPEFLELARMLEARLPSPEDDLDGEDPDAVWTDGPLTGRCDRAVFVLGVRSERIEDALPVVREVAARLQLGLFDMQSGEIQLPGQLPLAAISEPQSALAEPAGPPSVKDIERMACEALAPLLKRHGFVTAGKRYIFRARTGFRISIIADDEWMEPIIGLSVFHLSRELSRLNCFMLNSWDPDRPEAHGYFCCDPAGFVACVGASAPAIPGVQHKRQNHGSQYWWIVSSEASLQEWIGIARDYLERAVLPLLAACQNWADIDRFADDGRSPHLPLVREETGRRKKDNSFEPLRPDVQQRLWVSWLARSRHFDELADALIELEQYPSREMRQLRWLRNPDNRLRFPEQVAEPVVAVRDLADSASLTEPAQIMQYVRETLLPIMNEHGFNWQAGRGQFVRQQADFDLIMGLACERWTAPFRFSLSVHAWGSDAFKRMLAAVRQCALDHPLLESGVRATFSKFTAYADGPLPALPDDYDSRFDLHTVADLKACVAVLLAHLRHAVLPVLEDCRDWGGLDRYCSSAPLAEAPFGREHRYRKLKHEIPRNLLDIDPLAKVLVARLANSPHVDALCEQMKTSMLNELAERRDMPALMRALKDGFTHQPEGDLGE